MKSTKVGTLIIRNFVSFVVKWIFLVEAAT